MKTYKRYKISKSGEVYNKYGKQLKNNKHNLGYRSVLICDEGSRTRKYVHRLVAGLYVPNLENKPYVNHINGIKDDNRADNLEWVTAKENTKHARETKLLVTPKGKENKLSKPLYVLHPDGTNEKYWGTRDAEEKLGIKRKYICRVLNGKRNHHKGIKFSRNKFT